MRRDPQLLEQALDLLRITGRLREDVAKDIQNWAGIVSDRPRVRLKEVTRRLRKIERTAAQLAQLLSAHDADVGDAFGPLVPLERCFSFLEKKDETFLMGLSQKSRHLREDIVKDCGCGELRVRTRVTDKQSFVMQLVEIWARCRGHIGLSSYEGGPLFMFILKCWQWATGEEDISGLRHYLQQEIPSRRELLKQSAAERKAILARGAGRKLLSIGQTPPRKKVRSSA